MFKSKFLLLIVIVSIAFISCKKESLTTSATPSISDALIKTKTEGNNVETYYYDNQKRLTKVVFSSTDNSDTYYYEYSYTADNVSEYHSNETIHGLEETVSGITRFYCTSNPRSLKLNSEGYFLGNTSTCEEKSFKYDEAGFVISQNYAVTDYNRNDELKNNKSNITTMNSNGNNYLGGNFTTVTTFDYFSDKLNTIGNKNFGKNFLGKSSQNLVKSAAENNLITTYSYNFDAQQKVIKASVLSGLSKTETTYSYY